MREVIATGKTVEQATENGCAQLGRSRDELSVEILEMPQKKLFKSTPAKVLVRLISDDENSEKQQIAVNTVQVQNPPENKAKIAVNKPENMAAAPAPTAQAHAGKAAARRAAGQLPVLHSEPEEEILLANNPRAAQAVGYLASILEAMGAPNAKITALQQGDATLLRVEEQFIAEKVEIRGEVIQALSYLIDRAVNAGIDKRQSEYLRVRLDIAGYRNRREVELLALAQRTGQEVVGTGKSRTLAPMNPYERLIIHTAIGDMPGLISESIGADTQRRVVVKPVATGQAGQQRPPRGRQAGGHGGARPPQQGAYGRPSQARPSSTPQREFANSPHRPGTVPVVPQRRQAISDGEELPLYGKIEI